MSRSLWLLLPPPVEQEVQSLIEGFSTRFATPRFRPHITLLGGAKQVDEARLRELVRDGEIELRPRGISHAQDFFRCVVLEVELTPDLELLRKRAEERLGGGGEYRPHISLIYGELPQGTREEIVHEIRDLRFEPFPAAGLSAVNTSGEVAQWRTLAEITF